MRKPTALGAFVLGLVLLLPGCGRDFELPVSSSGAQALTVSPSGAATAPCQTVGFALSGGVPPYEVSGGDAVGSGSRGGGGEVAACKSGQGAGLSIQALGQGSFSYTASPLGSERVSLKVRDHGGSELTLIVNVGAKLGLSPGRATVTADGDLNFTQSGGGTISDPELFDSGYLMARCEADGVSCSSPLECLRSGGCSSLDATAAANRIRGRFGVGAEALIYHAGSNLELDPAGVGGLIARGGRDLVRVTDDTGEQTTAELSVGTPLQLYPEDLQIGQGGSGSLQVVGGTAPYSWYAVAANDAMGVAVAPPCEGLDGLPRALSSSKDAFAGLPGSAQSTLTLESKVNVDSAGHFVIQAGDYWGADRWPTPDQDPFFFAVVVDASGRFCRAIPVEVTPALAPPPAAEQVSRSGALQRLHASGGTPPYRYEFAARGNRSGGTLDADGGYTPGPNGGHVDRLLVEDRAGQTIAFSISVLPASISPATLEAHSSLNSVYPRQPGTEAVAGQLVVSGAALFFDALAGFGLNDFPAQQILDVADVDFDGLPEVLTLTDFGMKLGYTSLYRGITGGGFYLQAHGPYVPSAALFGDPTTGAGEIFYPCGSDQDLGADSLLDFLASQSPTCVSSLPGTEVVQVIRTGLSSLAELRNEPVGLPGMGLKGVVDLIDLDSDSGWDESVCLLPAPIGVASSLGLQVFPLAITAAALGASSLPIDPIGGAPGGSGPDADDLALLLGVCDGGIDPVDTSCPGGQLQTEIYACLRRHHLQTFPPAAPASPITEGVAILSGDLSTLSLPPDLQDLIGLLLTLPVNLLPGPRHVVPASSGGFAQTTDLLVSAEGIALRLSATNLGGGQPSLAFSQLGFPVEIVGRGDLDQDGLDDLVAFDPLGTLNFLPGQEGGLAPEGLFARNRYHAGQSPGPYRLFVADLDGAGGQDLLAANLGEARVLLANRETEEIFSGDPDTASLLGLGPLCGVALSRSDQIDRVGITLVEAVADLDPGDDKVEVYGRTKQGGLALVSFDRKTRRFLPPENLTELGQNVLREPWTGELGGQPDHADLLVFEAEIDPITNTDTGNVILNLYRDAFSSFALPALNVGPADLVSSLQQFGLSLPSSAPVLPRWDRAETRFAVASDSGELDLLVYESCEEEDPCDQANDPSFDRALLRFPGQRDPATGSYRLGSPSLLGRLRGAGQLLADPKSKRVVYLGVRFLEDPLQPPPPRILELDEFTPGVSVSRRRTLDLSSSFQELYIVGEARYVDLDGDLSSELVVPFYAGVGSGLMILGEDGQGALSLMKVMWLSPQPSSVNWASLDLDADGHPELVTQLGKFTLKGTERFSPVLHLLASDPADPFQYKAVTPPGVDWSAPNPQACP